MEEVKLDGKTYLIRESVVDDDSKAWDDGMCRLIYESDYRKPYCKNHAAATYALYSARTDAEVLAAARSLKKVYDAVLDGETVCRDDIVETGDGEYDWKYELEGDGSGPSWLDLIGGCCYRPKTKSFHDICNGD